MNIIDVEEDNHFFFIKKLFGQFGFSNHKNHSQQTLQNQCFYFALEIRFQKTY